MSRLRVIVVGGGIVGAACAMELARDGVAVNLLEGATTGGGATAAGMGHIVLLDDSEPQYRLTRWSQQLWAQVAPQLPAAAQAHTCGCIWVAANREEMQLVHEKEAAYRDRGVPAELLDAHALARAEPNLRPGLAGGLLLPQDSVVYPPVAARWMLECAAAAGAEVATGARVVAIDGASVRLADGSQRHADWVVDAAGHAALDLLPPVAGLRLRPRKGHLAITQRVPGFVRHQLVELGYLASAHSHSSASVAFNAQPRPTGQVMIGSSRQYDSRDDSVEPRILARMIERAIHYLPGIAQLQVVRTWTGFRAATEDKLPLLGPVPGHPGLLLATGHEGLGITTSLATGCMIADWVGQRPSAIDRLPYAVERCLEAA